MKLRPSDTLKKAPRLLVAAIVVAVLLWFRLFYGVLTNAPPARPFTYFDANGRVVDSVLCSGSLVADGARVWALCAQSGKGHVGRFDVDAGRMDLSPPIETGRELEGFLRAGEDVYLAVGALRGHKAFRVHSDGRVDDLGTVDDGSPIRGFALVNDHLEVVTGFTLPAVHVQEGAAWKRRAIAYRDDDYRSRSLQLAYREGAAWKLVVARFPATSPPDAPLNIDVEVGDESGKWETTQQIAIPARYAFRSKDGSITPDVHALIDPSAGNAIALLGGSELPYTFRNGRLEPNTAPATVRMPGFWRSNASWEDNRLVSVASNALGSTATTALRGRWMTATTDPEVFLQELPGDKRSPRAVVPATNVFELLPQPQGYVLLSAFHRGTYARVGDDLRRSDPPNALLRFRLLDAPWWKKLIVALLLLSPIGLYLWRHSRRIEPLSLAYLFCAVVLGIWVLPILSTI